jgi:hypothetical protein
VTHLPVARETIRTPPATCSNRHCSLAAPVASCRTSGVRSAARAPYRSAVVPVRPLVIENQDSPRGVIAAAVVRDTSPVYGCPPAVTAKRYVVLGRRPTMRTPVPAT